MRFPRTSGILLHPTSLPGPFGSGDLGQSSYHFVEWLKTAGQSLWQMLPLCPAGMGNSPYMGLSAFAGNPLLIDLQDLANKGWVSPHELSSSSHFYAHRVDFRQVNSFRMEKLRQAAITFFSSPKNNHHTLYEEFCEAKKSWLDDYALFMALNEHHGKKEWVTWDESLTKRKPDALKKAQKELSQEISFWKFLQWCFFFQWHALKKSCDEYTVAHQLPVVNCPKGLEPDIWVRPKLVCAVRADEITRSPIHSAGYALRFPRFMEMRIDKNPTDGTTVNEIVKLFKDQRFVHAWAKKRAS